MLKVGLIGIGFMGRGHLDQYLRLAEEGAPIQLEAICDIDPDKFNNVFVPGNLDVGAGPYDFSPYRLYTDMEDLFQHESGLDYVDIALPTYLHPEASIRAMRAGFHVLCEKPMALTPELCQSMIDASQETGKTLMIAQCLRFWPAYETLKATVDGGTLGRVTGGYFFRGGRTPAWSYEEWLMDEARSGGCIMDQHVHDVDTIQWLFGPAEAVSTLAQNVIPGAGCDIISTHYRYPGMVINAQDDWSMNANVPFSMTFRVNFEHGTLIWDGADTLTIYADGQEPVVADNCQGDSGYYREIRYFADCLEKGVQPDRATLESTKRTIAIATRERESARQRGAWLSLDVE